MVLAKVDELAGIFTVSISWLRFILLLWCAHEFNKSLEKFLFLSESLDRGFCLGDEYFLLELGVISVCLSIHLMNGWFVLRMPTRECVVCRWVSRPIMRKAATHEYVPERRPHLGKRVPHQFEAIEGLNPEHTSNLFHTDIVHSPPTGAGRTK